MSPQLLLLLDLVSHHSNDAISTVGLPMSFGVLLGLALAALFCGVVTLLLYRRNPKKWHWYASAGIDGILAYLFYDGLLHFIGISQQPALILSLVLAALLFAVYLFPYYRSGVSTKEWFAFTGWVIAGLLFFALLGFFFFGVFGLFAPFMAYLIIVNSLWQRSRTR